MTLDLRLVLYSTLLTWLMIVTASFLRTRSWSLRGVSDAFSNRDDLPAPSPLSGRADRAARNMLENLVLFAALVMVAQLSDAEPTKLALGARIFFWSRVVYFPVYLLGIRYVRSIAWLVSLVGLWMIVQATLS